MERDVRHGGGRGIGGIIRENFERGAVRERARWSLTRSTGEGEGKGDNPRKLRAWRGRRRSKFEDDWEAGRGSGTSLARLLHRDATHFWQQCVPKNDTFINFFTRLGAEKLYFLSSSSFACNALFC